jgi:hypothetical protein
MGFEMNNERNLGVTDTRFALTILMCALVAVGYIALLKLGAPKEAPGDPDPIDSAQSITEAPLPPNPNVTEPPPQVLPLEKTDERGIDRTSQRANGDLPPDLPKTIERR